MSTYERGNPLTIVQRKTLVSLIKERENVIQGRSAEHLSNERKKTAWKEITALFNQANPYQAPRTAYQLRRCWEHIKRKVKREDLAHKIRLKTAGGRSVAPSFHRFTEDMVMASTMMTTSLPVGDRAMDTLITLHKDGPPPLGQGGETSVSEGGQDPINNGDGDPMNKGDGDPINKGGEDSMNKGGEDSMNKRGENSISKGGEDPMNNWGGDSISKGDNAPISERGKSPLGKSSTPPVAEKNAPPIDERGDSPVGEGSKIPVDASLKPSCAGQQPTRGEQCWRTLPSPGAKSKPQLMPRGKPTVKTKQDEAYEAATQRQEAEHRQRMRLMEEDHEDEKRHRERRTRLLEEKLDRELQLLEARHQEELRLMRDKHAQEKKHRELLAKLLTDQNRGRSHCCVHHL